MSSTHSVNSSPKLNIKNESTEEVVSDKKETSLKDAKMVKRFYKLYGNAPESRYVIYDSQCPVCCFNSIIESEFVEHVKGHIKEYPVYKEKKEKITLFCNNCNFTATSKKTLSSHIRYSCTTRKTYELRKNHKKPI